MLDFTGGARLVRACAAMEPGGTRSRFSSTDCSIANKKRKSRASLGLLVGQFGVAGYSPGIRRT
jgi:hypothetical protein